MKNNFTKFKIFPVKGEKEYYSVLIFNDRTSMRLFSAQLNKGKMFKMEAATHSFKASKMVKGKKVNVPIIGAMLFYREGFGNGVVSHEMAHAVNYYFLRNGIKFNIGGKKNEDWSDCDEMYAWALGYMVNQFWKKYNKSIGKKNLNERY